MTATDHSPQVQQLEPAGFRLRSKTDECAPWDYVHYRGPDDWELNEFEVQPIVAVVGVKPAGMLEFSDAALFRFGSEYGFPQTMQKTHPIQGPVYWTYDQLSRDEHPSARDAMVAEIRKLIAEGTAPAWLRLGPEAIPPTQGEVSPPQAPAALPEWLEELLDAADMVTGNAEFRTETEHRQFLIHLEELSSKVDALRNTTPPLTAGLVPFAYADPQAYLNFKHGVANHEWMWSRPDSGLITLYALPSLLAKPQALPQAQSEEHDLLMIARNTGLRGFLHGVNASDARELLANYVAALPITHEVQQLKDFFLTTERTLVQHQRDPIKAVAHLQALIEHTAAQRIAGQTANQEPKHG